MACADTALKTIEITTSYVDHLVPIARKKVPVRKESFALKEKK